MDKAYLGEQIRCTKLSHFVIKTNNITSNNSNVYIQLYEKVAPILRRMLELE
jgi:hypothetical protein